ncbi:S1/P1 Nuclease [Paraburkholderia sp. Tr-20389]|uniref:S1/P1 Nuclease n=1 Tax=Paraburkholderia sp. Tr-20389 TaxID=2703903 RepID=UPI0019821451|nr:S1/P1 Nuclease [Paraburkholderia sp. Tr-20389]MBN3755551.1 S1/P1 Nuclease [Paraburkholderia sp. Tr-20389]
MNPLSTQHNFQSLSLKDLLEARDLYHWHLTNKANVVGTAVGLYLIRSDEPWPDRERRSNGHAKARAEGKGIRTFGNSEVRPYSWPAVIVLVRDWVDATEFGHGKVDPDHMVPRTLYMPDGRAVPVCVVAVEPTAPATGAPAAARWPSTYIGGGCPLIADTQGIERTASVGCLVTDGHTTYALTNRHVCGEPGSPVKALLRGAVNEVGIASDRQLTREPFTAVFPEFAGSRSFLTLDVGLVEVHDANDWSSQPFGIEGSIESVADINELSLSLQLIDQSVTAFGSASGALDGTIKALFYRHKSLAGYDYVSQFLIAPASGSPQTQPGDSGTLWYLVAPANEHADDEGNRDVPARNGRKSDQQKRARHLYPLAIEWGGQTLASDDGQRLNYALATGLSTACQLLDVDLVRAQNVGANPYWGQTGHYSIATAAIQSVKQGPLRDFLEANVERISFRPDQLTPEQIREKLARGDFVELADVPDLVWKKTPSRVPGGRDYAQNAGPEHPNHYADIDQPDGDGKTLRDVTLGNIANMSVAVWSKWYADEGDTDARSEGLLPFRVWQIFDEMVTQLKKRNDTNFLCAAGVLAHYVGDACQPLHGSYHADGYKDAPDATPKKWPGKGVHATYEDKMVDRHSNELLSQIGPQANAFEGEIPKIGDGRGAAFATVALMAEAAKILAPSTLIDEYIRLGGGSSARVVDGLWDAFGEDTAKLMGAGARYLAAMWEAAYAVADTSLPAGEREISEKALAKVYQDKTFLPSLTLDKIGPVIG